MDRQRLEFERKEMGRFTCLRDFRLFVYKFRSRAKWSTYSWEGITPTGHVLTARYPDDYPYSQLQITAEPDVRTHHKLSGNYLCVMEPHQWSPDFTAATNILIAFRFLEDHVRGNLG